MEGIEKLSTQNLKVVIQPIKETNEAVQQYLINPIEADDKKLNFSLDGLATNNSALVKSFGAKNKLSKTQKEKFCILKNFDYIEPLVRNTNFTKKGFANYLKKLDIKAIRSILPEDYSDNNFLIFLFIHYMQGTTEFKSDNLLKINNLSKLLEDNLITKDGLSMLFNAFPHTSKKIGNIPSSWVTKLQNKDVNKVIDEIYSSIYGFIANNDIDAFQERLKSLFKANVVVKKIGVGEFGTSYKISIDGIPAVCLKTFHEINPEVGCNMHGAYNEPQMALFANKHSNNYVKMYFGNLAGSQKLNKPSNKTQAFLVTQYLDKSIIPENTGIDSDVAVLNTDIKNANVIQGKIVDFGGIYTKR